MNLKYLLKMGRSSLQFYNSSPHLSNVAQAGTPKSQGLQALSPHSPKKPVPPTPGTALQQKLKILGSQMQLQLKQEMILTTKITTTKYTECYYCQTPSLPYSKPSTSQVSDSKS